MVAEGWTEPGRRAGIRDGGVACRGSEFDAATVGGEDLFAYLLAVVWAVAVKLCWPSAQFPEANVGVDYMPQPRSRSRNRTLSAADVGGECMATEVMVIYGGAHKSHRDA